MDIERAARNLRLTPFRPEEREFTQDGTLITLSQRWNFVPGFDASDRVYTRQNGYFHGITTSNTTVRGKKHTLPREVYVRENQFRFNGNELIRDQIGIWTDFLNSVDACERISDLPDQPGPSHRIIGGSANHFGNKLKQDSRSVPLAFVQLPNTFVCANLAMANMIYYMNGGGMEKARHFLRICDSRAFHFYTVREFNTILRKVFPTKTFRKVDPNKFDVLETVIPFDRPTLVQLENTGGYITHSIGIMRDIIFDSCNHFTLKRTKENLDHACRPMQFRSVISVSELVDDVTAPSQATTRSNKRRRSSKRSQAPKSLRR